MTEETRQQAIELLNQLRETAPPGGGKQRRGAPIECGEIIQKIMKLLDLDTRRFAKEVNVCELSVIAWVRNKTFPSVPSLHKMRRYLEPETSNPTTFTGYRPDIAPLISGKLFTRKVTPYTPRPKSGNNCALRPGRGRKLKGIWNEILHVMKVHDAGGPVPEIKELVAQFVDEFGGGTDGLAEYLGVPPQRIEDFKRGAQLPTAYEGYTWHNLCTSDRIYFGYEPLLQYGEKLIDRINLGLTTEELYFLIGEK